MLLDHLVFHIVPQNKFLTKRINHFQSIVHIEGGVCWCFCITENFSS